MSYYIIEPNSGATDGIYANKEDADGICQDMNGNALGLKFHVIKTHDGATLTGTPRIADQPWFWSLYKDAA